MTGRTSGMATALADALAQTATAPGADGQVELFDPVDFGDDLPGPTAAVAKSGPKGGRPVGRQNKSTEQLRAYIAAHYKHPLIVMAEMWSRTPRELAEEMGLYDYQYFEGVEIARHLAVGEAARLQQAALQAALPYLAQKMPLQIEQKIKQMGVLLLGDFKGRKVAGADGLPLPEHDDVVDVTPERSPLGGDAS